MPVSQGAGGIPPDNGSTSAVWTNVVPPENPRPRRSAKRVVPFWILQAAEIGAVVALADLSLHVGHGGLLVAGGAALALLAVTAKGPLGILRICGRRLHLVLVMTVAALLAVAPIVPALRPDIQGIIIVEFVGVGMIRLATLTRTDGRTNRSTRANGVGPVIDTTAMVAGNAGGGPPAHTGETNTRTTPNASPPAGSAARWAGRATGAAATAAARSAAKHRPAAEAQLKRTIRGAGRLAAKVTSAPEDDGTRPG